MGGDRYLERTYDRSWYELYEGDKPVLVGHHDYLGDGCPWISQDRVFGLDTGGVTGGRLTGLLLTDFRMVSVPSRDIHWLRVRGLYREAGDRKSPFSKTYANLCRG